MKLYPLRITCPRCKQEATTKDVLVTDAGLIRVQSLCVPCAAPVHADFTLLEIMQAIAGDSGANHGVN